MKNKPKSVRFTGELKERVLNLLKEDFSSEQICGRFRKQGKETVSPETIYKYIWDDKAKGGELYLHLRSQGRKFRKRGDSKDTWGIIKNRVSIDKRPESVEKKNKFGDFEGDLIIGKTTSKLLLHLMIEVLELYELARLKAKRLHKLVRIWLRT